MSDARPTRDAILMSTAHLWSKRSTCSRAHVGVVIARDGRSLVTGYNGAPKGLPHCQHHCQCDLKNAGWRPEEAQRAGIEHATWCPAGPCKNAVHAEANAIAWAARNGVRLEGSVLYTTFSPCLACAQLIVNAGVIEVVHAQHYRDRSPLELLATAGIGTRHLTPDAGF
jgi:dCMP deaminase